MYLELIDLENVRELDEFVLAHPHGHVMQSSYWGRVKTDWAWNALLLRGEGGAICGSMALLQRRMAVLGGSLVYSPRGPVWDAGDMDALKALLCGAERFAVRRGAALLRLDPMLTEDDEVHKAFFRQAGYHLSQREDSRLYHPRLCYRLPLAGLTAETLEQGYHRSVRTNLHKAQRLGVTVRRCGAEELGTFCRLMAHTAQKNGFTARPESYYRALLRGLGPYAGLYLAELGGRALAGAIVVFFGPTASLLYSCSDPESFKLHPNEALQHRLHLDAIKASCDTYDFRGVEGRPVPDNPHVGLHRFKAGFGAEFCAYLGQLDKVYRPLPAAALWLCARLARL